LIGSFVRPEWVKFTGLVCAIFDKGFFTQALHAKFVYGNFPGDFERFKTALAVADSMHDPAGFAGAVGVGFLTGCEGHIISPQRRKERKGLF
jgi:hypothetical protein